MSVELLKAIAPELATETDERLSTFLELAAQRISARVFGRVYAQAACYLAAHLLTLANRATQAGVAGAGPVASVGTGGLSVSFGQIATNTATADASLKSTSYGLEFLALRSSRAGTKPMLVRS